MPNKGPIKGYVVVKKPGETATLEIITKKELDYKFLQSHVEGYIECMRAGTMSNGKSIDIWINEEGKLNGMKPNLLLPHDVVCGPIVICLGTQGGDSIPFPDFGFAMDILTQTMRWHIEDPDSVEVPEPQIEIKFGDDAKKEMGEE